MKNPPSKDDKPAQDGPRLHRRGFFTEGLRQFFKPLADMVEDKIQSLDLPDARSEPASPPAALAGAYGWSPGFGGASSPSRTDREPTYLRPPGALPEGEFLSRCSTCAKCVEACPVRAIKLTDSSDPRLHRKPVIEAALQACVVCDDLSCMKVCPTGALQRVPRENIRMGTASLRRDQCLRTKGEDCQLCVDKCPIGTAAIDIPYFGAEIVVKADGCTGCGVCEMYCPTDPKAIVIEPRERF